MLFLSLVLELLKAQHHINYKTCFQTLCIKSLLNVNKISKTKNKKTNVVNMINIVLYYKQ